MVLFLLSGGGSALFEEPLIPPEELQDVTNQLLACGADIVEMNTIRKRLSAVKGGAVSEDLGAVAQRLALRCRRAAQLPDTADHLGMDVLHRLGCLPVQALQRGGAEAQAVFPDDLPGLGAGGRVRRRRAGGDHIQRVAHDVRQDHRPPATAWVAATRRSPWPRRRSCGASGTPR